MPRRIGGNVCCRTRSNHSAGGLSLGAVGRAVAYGLVLLVVMAFTADVPAWAQSAAGMPPSAMATSVSTNLPAPPGPVA